MSLLAQLDGRTSGIVDNYTDSNALSHDDMVVQKLYKTYHSYGRRTGKARYLAHRIR